MKIEGLKKDTAVWVRGYADGLGDIDFLDGERSGMLDCLCEEYILSMSKSDFRLDETTQPQLEVLQFVADWIEKYKEKRCRLYHALEHVFDDVELGLYIKQQEDDYTEIIAKAWLYGYTVKKEKLYTVEIPNPHEKQLSFVLMRKPGGNISINVVHSSNLDLLKTDNDLQLTEKEIKKDFDWAFRWAEEVTK